MTKPGQTEPHARAEVFDDALSWLVPSRTRPSEIHKVELGDYAGAGRCSCMDFQTRFEPLLARMVTPERALAEGLVKLRDYQLSPEDALSCWHIIEARRRLAHHVIKAFKTAATALRDRA